MKRLKSMMDWWEIFCVENEKYWKFLLIPTFLLLKEKVSCKVNFRAGSEDLWWDAVVFLLVTISDLDKEKQKPINGKGNEQVKEAKLTACSLLGVTYLAPS